MKLLLIMTQLLFYLSTAWSQETPKFNTIGKVYDFETKRPLSGASVIIQKNNDSTPSKSVLTDANGTFNVDNLTSGNYVLRVTFVGYETFSHHFSHTTNKTLQLGIIHMNQTDLKLAQVEIVQRASPIKVKKDTIEYNSKYFAITENASTEELLRKIPGIKIDENGQISINGITVKSLLIDGRQVYIDNISVATRNILAEMIDKVQIIDRFPNNIIQTSGSGKEKVINVTIRKQRLNELTGQLTSAIGTSQKYTFKSNISRFRTNQQLLIAGNGDNINNFQGGRITNNDGLLKTWYMSTNYNQDISPQIGIYTNYAINNEDKTNQRNSHRTNLLKEGSYINLQGIESESTNTTHTISLGGSYRIDSTSALNIQSQSNYIKSKSHLINKYESILESGKILNNGIMQNIFQGSSTYISNKLIFDKRFKKNMRKFKAIISYDDFKNLKNEYVSSNNTFVKTDGNKLIDTINQLNKNNNKNEIIQLSVSYSEPVFGHSSLELINIYTRTNTQFNRPTFDYNNHSKSYDKLNDSISNSYKNTSVINYTGLNYNFTKDHYELKMGISTYLRDMQNTNYSRPNTIKQKTIAWMPKVSFMYSINPTAQLQAQYSLENQIPDADQLQTVPDNTNSIFIRLGNPNLKISKINNYNLSFTRLNSETLNSLTINLTASFTQNKIIDATWLDSIGRQIIQPINSSGNYLYYGYVDNSFQLIKSYMSIKSITAISLLKENTKYSLEPNSIKTLSLIQQTNLYYTTPKNLDLSLNLELRYTNINSGRSNANKSLNYSAYLNCNYIFLGGLKLNNNIYYFRNQYNGSTNDGLLINASITKNVFKHDRGSIQIQVFDLLNQNSNVNTNTSNNYIETIQDKVMTKFYMISFSYFIKKNKH